jgi:multidrug resistance efflux pump
MNVFSEVWIEMSAEQRTQRLAQINANLVAELARIREVRDAELAQENARAEAAIAAVLARYDAAMERIGIPQPGAVNNSEYVSQPGSGSGGRRHKRTHKRPHRR